MSGTSSDFTIDLPETAQLEDNMLCQIDEVSIPHSWYSINDPNKKYFGHQIFPPNVGAGATYRKIPIPAGNYTASQLTTELETQLNNHFDTGDRPDTYTVRYNATKNKIRISVNYSAVIFIVLTDGEVAPFAGSFVETVDVNNLTSINRVMGNLTPAPDANTSLVPYITNFIDFVPSKNLYLHCNEISNFNQLRVAGNSSIIKKVNVTVPYLGVVYDFG